jgi:hypothetical protein
MLERVPKIQKIYRAAANKNQRKLIEDGVAAQKPLLESVLGKNVPFFLMCCAAERSRLPRAPDIEFLDFAESVARAWDKADRRELEMRSIPPAFCLNESLDSALFSMRSRKDTSMRVLLAPARASMSRIRLLEGLKRMRDGGDGIEAAKEELSRAGVVLPSIGFRGAYAIYSTKKGATVSVMDLDREIEWANSKLPELLAPVAKRLCFGFSELL